MQLNMAYERILDRFPNIYWTGKQKIEPIILVHAISSLKVNLYGKGAKRASESRGQLVTTGIKNGILNATRRTGATILEGKWGG